MNDPIFLTLDEVLYIQAFEADLNKVATKENLAQYFRDRSVVKEA